MGLFGLDSNSSTSNTYNQQVALNAGGLGVSGGVQAGTNSQVNIGDPKVAEKALDTAQALANVSLESTYYTLSALQSFQDRGLKTVDAAVGAANGIAAQAAPVNAEVLAKNNSKTFVLVAAIAAVALILTRKKT